MPELSGSVAKQVRNYGITGIAIHLTGFVIGFLSIGLVFGGVIGIESGVAMLTPFADTLFGLGLVIVIAVVARAGVPMKYLLVAGAVIGVGLFYKSTPHEIHVASGIGFGLPHNGHIVIGTILITISVIALGVLTYTAGPDNRVIGNESKARQRARRSELRVLLPEKSQDISSNRRLLPAMLAGGNA